MTPAPKKRSSAAFHRRVSWALTALCSVAFSGGAYQVRDVTSELRLLRDELAKIGSRLSVIESNDARENTSARLRETERATADHEARLRALEQNRKG